jgi:hypothetical protein
MGLAGAPEHTPDAWLQRPNPAPDERLSYAGVQPGHRQGYLQHAFTAQRPHTGPSCTSTSAPPVRIGRMTPRAAGVRPRPSPTGSTSLAPQSLGL